MAAKFAEIFEGHALDNVMFVVQRDMKTRLDEFYASDNLPDFAERTLGAFTSLAYPGFGLDPVRGRSIEGEAFIETELLFEAAIRVVDTDPVGATRKAVKYARAFKSVIRGASRADLFRNITSPQIMPVSVDIPTWTWGRIGKSANAPNPWIREIAFEISFKFNER